MNTLKTHASKVGIEYHQAMIRNLKIVNLEQFDN